MQIDVNGIRLRYEVSGSGPPLVLVMGSGSSGRAWHPHQVPAFVAAGHQVITFDNRGIGPDAATHGEFTVDDLVTDTAALIEQLGVGPCRIAGTSLGAFVAAELALARPDLVSRVALLATRAHTDVMRRALTEAEIELADSGAVLPARYVAAMRAVQYLSPRTLDDDRAVTDWLDLFELSPLDPAAVRAQLALDLMPDRRAAYRDIRVPCLVVSFSDDLVCPPGAGRDVASAIPGAEYVQIDGCGHYGYLERPDEVNRAVLDFLQRP